MNAAFSDPIPSDPEGENPREQREPQTRSAILETSRPYDAEALSRALNRLADNGWNSVIIPGFLGGYPLFPSAVWAEKGLPSQHPAFKKWNPLEVAFDVAWRRNLDILMAVKPYLIDQIGRHKPPILKKHPNWAATVHPNRRKRLRGHPRPAQVFYCPVNTELRHFLSDTLYTVAEGYPFHGMMFDLRHYPFYSSSDNFVLYCYCDACRNASLRDLGFDPAGVDLEKEGSMVKRWQEWQELQMDQAMAYIRLRVLKARFTMRILGLLSSGAGIIPDSPKPLIHWKSWVERSLVEMLVLDGYSSDLAKFDTQLTDDLEMLPKDALLLPMLPRNVKNAQSFLDTYRRLPVPGLITRFDDWDRPDFDPNKRIMFSTPAFSVESDPLFSVCALFEKLANLPHQHKDFSAFLADLQLILCSRDLPLTVDRLLMIADNVRGLQNHVQEGKLDFGEHRNQVIHDLDLAARLIYLTGCDLMG